MYIFDFFKNLAKKSKIPAIIYLVFNVFFTGALISLLFWMPYWRALLIGLGLYAVSLVIALSPIGEFILRLMTGCRKIKRGDQIQFLQPLFDEVYEKAKEMDPSISDQVKLYMNGDKDPNAFATGRKTICVTEGLLQMPEEQIKATLGHEFGHLAHKDTDLILVISVGNMIVNAIILLIRFIIEAVHYVLMLVSLLVGGKEGLAGVFFTFLSHVLMTIFVSGLTWLWTKIGILLVMKTSRGEEYEADKFSFDLGYGNELCALLDNIAGNNEPGLFANLASSHPDKDDRIAELQALGATYRATYGVQTYGARKG